MVQSCNNQGRSSIVSDLTWPHITNIDQSPPTDIDIFPLSVLAELDERDDARVIVGINVLKKACNSGETVVA